VLGGVEDRGRSVARGERTELVADELRGDVLEGDHEVLRRAPPALARGHEGVGVHGGPSCLLVELSLVVQQRAHRPVLSCPAPGRRERHHAASPPARSQLERQPASERVAHHVRQVEAGLVHRPLDAIGQRSHGRRALQRRAACVTGQRHGQDVVATLQPRKHELPGAPRVQEPVQAEQRRAVARAMGRGEVAEVAHRSHGPGVMDESIPRRTIAPDLHTPAAVRAWRAGPAARVSSAPARSLGSPP
jgi:hypothetical protein